MKKTTYLLLMTYVSSLIGDHGMLKISLFEEPSFEQPICQVATAEQFRDPKFSFWCDELKCSNRPHRKLWEFCYIAQALSNGNYL